MECFVLWKSVSNTLLFIEILKLLLLICYGFIATKKVLLQFCYGFAIILWQTFPRKKWVRKHYKRFKIIHLTRRKTVKITTLINEVAIFATNLWRITSFLQNCRKLVAILRRIASRYSVPQLRPICNGVDFATHICYEPMSSQMPLFSYSGKTSLWNS